VASFVLGHEANCGFWQVDRSRQFDPKEADMTSKRQKTANARPSPDVRFVEPQTNGVERVDINSFHETRFAAEKPPQFGLQRVRQRVREGRQQDAGVGVRARQMSRPV
jgi:hypothetical protein